MEAITFFLIMVFLVWFGYKEVYYRLFGGVWNDTIMSGVIIATILGIIQLVLE